MNKKKLGLLIVSLVLFISYFFILNKNISMPTIPPVSKPQHIVVDTVDKKIDDILSNMTIEEKIGQMLVIYDTKSKVDDELKEFISDIKPGGFIINQNNITTYEKTKKYISDLQKNSDIPLMISIDQEGGKVQRLQVLEDIKALYIPDMLSLGNTSDENLAYEVGRVMAEEMRTLGINVVYAPVCDIFSNPNNTVIGNRSFGKTPELVSKMCTSLGKGLEDNGIIATYKHFPGHGDTEADSHYSLPVINKSIEQLLNFELVPFINAIKNDAKIIMIGHIALPNLDGNTPASLSKKIITDLLKEQLGFDGLVITDALNMGALTDNYSDEEIYTKAIEAGVDILLMPNNAYDAVKYIKNNITEERINESVRKILLFKYKYFKDSILDSSYLNSKEHQEIINKIPVE